MLKIESLKAKIDDKKILKGVNLSVDKGSVVAIMGPNGSGKSTLSNIIMGNPSYSVEGKIFFEEENILDLFPDERSKKGIFLSFQYPVSIPGVTVSSFLKAVVESHKGKIHFSDFLKDLKEKIKLLDIPESFLSRFVNVNFSGGEKKRLEMLQLLMIKPKLAILDETDSGLDIDALNLVAKTVKLLKEENPSMSFLIITHYNRILKLIEPDKIYIMLNGRIVKEGDKILAEVLEEKGYDWIKKEIKEIKDEK